MTGRIGMNNKDAARFLDPTAEGGRTEGCRSYTGGLQVGNGQVEMELLRRPIRPVRG